MRALAAIVIVSLAGVTAAAEPKPGAKPARSPAAASAASSTCKRRVVGRGLERKVVCEFEAAVVVKSDAPRPSVMIVPRDGRTVVGRPRSTDPLVGLDRRLR